jgi:hypothetical protein
MLAAGMLAPKTPLMGITEDIVENARIDHASAHWRHEGMREEYEPDEFLEWIEGHKLFVIPDTRINFAIARHSGSPVFDLSRYSHPAVPPLMLFQKLWEGIVKSHLSGQLMSLRTRHSSACLSHLATAASMQRRSTLRNTHLLHRPGALIKPLFDVLYSKVHTPSHFDERNFPLATPIPDSPFAKTISRFQTINIQKPSFHRTPPHCNKTSM